MKLENVKAVITGAGSGLGEGTAEEREYQDRAVSRGGYLCDAGYSDGEAAAGTHGRMGAAEGP